MASYRLPTKQDEVWLPAKLFDYDKGILEDLPDYFVSNLGRMCHKVNGKYKLMKQAKIPEGYLTCNIGKIRKKVHRIVASTFLTVPKDIEKPVVDHKNNDKTDNTMLDPFNEDEEKRGNLHWVSIQKNTLLAYEENLVSERKMRKVLVVDENENGVLYYNQRIASKATGVDSKRISQVVRGIVAKAGGYRFIRFNNFTDLSDQKKLKENADETDN